MLRLRMVYRESKIYRDKRSSNRRVEALLKMAITLRNTHENEEGKMFSNRNRFLREVKVLSKTQNPLYKDEGS